MTRNSNSNTTTRTWRKRVFIAAGILFVIWLIFQLHSCSSTEYHMELNGDNPFILIQNDVFEDPGVTFYDDGNNQVSSEKQSELEKEVTIIGLEELNNAVIGEYAIIYQYEDQSLSREVQVTEKAQEPDNSEDPVKPDIPIGPNDPNGTEEPTEIGNKTDSNDGNNDKDNGNNSNPPISVPTDTSNPQPTPDTSTETNLGVYYLPDDVTFTNQTFTYDGKEHTITANNVPAGIKAVYSNNAGTEADTYEATVTFALTGTLKKQYSSVDPSTMTATLTIRKATPKYVVPDLTELTTFVGNTLADIKLPKGFSFEDPLSTPVGPEGINTFLVTFTPTDTDNYKTVEHIEVQIWVKPKDGGNDNKVVFNLPDNVTFDNGTFTYDGRPHTITVKNLPHGIKATYFRNRATNAGTYRAIVVFSLGDELKDTCYAVNPSRMTAVLTINKAIPEYKVPTNLTARVGQTLANVKLPHGFTFEDPLTTSVGSVGTHVFKVTFTPDDTLNYEIVEHIKVSIKVIGNGGEGSGEDPVKPVYHLPANVTFDDLVATYTGSEYVITVKNLPAGINVSYNGNRRTNAGSQIATATFSLSDSLKQSYSSVEPSTMTATLTINPATPHYTIPTGLTAVEGQTLADVTLPKGFTFEDPLSTSVGPVGTNSFTVTYTPDSPNYAIVRGITVTITVKAKTTPTKPVFNLPANVTFGPTFTETYTGTPFTFTASNVPNEVDVTYANNVHTDAGGPHTATATFTLKDAYKDTYSGVSPSTLTATITIKQATPAYTVPTGLEAEEGQTLADVTLPQGFTFEDPLSTSVGPVGTNSFMVTYNPNSPNYAIVRGIPVTITVKAKTTPTKPVFDTSGISFGPTFTGTYTGTPLTFTASNIPAEIDVTYTNNVHTDAGGPYTATATFTLKDAYKDTYSGVSVSSLEATITINQATPSYTLPSGLTAIEGQTLGEISLPSGFSFNDPSSTPVGSPGDNSFSVTFTPSDTKNYATLTNLSVTITVTAEDPGGSDKPDPTDPDNPVDDDVPGKGDTPDPTDPDNPVDDDVPGKGDTPEPVDPENPVDEEIPGDNENPEPTDPENPVDEEIPGNDENPEPTDPENPVSDEIPGNSDKPDPADSQNQVGDEIPDTGLDVPVINALVPKKESVSTASNATVLEEKVSAKDTSNPDSKKFDATVFSESSNDANIEEIASMVD